MKKWGISIYNDKASLAENKAYIDRASQYGFSRIFSCLLSIDVTKKEQVIDELHQVNDYAKQKGMEVILDVNPRVFQDLGIGYKDLSFFKQTGADGIRLDIGFTGAEEALMTFNPEGLLIEINMSIDTHAIDTIIDYMPNTNRLIGCHNFYPHRYTGLTEPFFLKTSHAFKQFGLRTAAFISSNEATFGPWAIMEGLPTLELLRTLPIDVQAKYMILQNGLIDDVIISNCFASEAELRQVGQLRKEYVEFAVDLATDIPATERAIVLEELHVRRGDINDYVIRSTQPRVKYKGHPFNAFNTPDIKRGDVIIETSEYGHYAGELQIALQDMKNSGKSNVVARVREAELFLLDRLRPWQKFGFVVNSNNG
jgi:hypothetical protein